jgi:predicted nucleic acid-binding protein
MTARYRRFGTRRVVFVDASAFAAIADPTVMDAGPAVRNEFEHLLDEYERGETILVTLETMAAPVLSEVCEIERMRPWLARAAHQVLDDNPYMGLDPDLAAALVVMERRSIGEVLTIDPRFDALDVTVLPVRGELGTPRRRRGSEHR